MAAYAEAGAAIRPPRYTQVVLRLLRWFDSSAWRKGGLSRKLDAPIVALAPRLLHRRRRAVRRRAKGFAGQSPERRHRLRIALKKLRYAGELLSGLYDTGVVARFTKPLKRLQDQLGDANDLRVAREIIAELQ